ncbi:MAG: ABC transporter ATP-binding protein [Desulfobacteraceae bacterium]|nr:ABC transporter ATP-binding protein [Desulfobacteraceae bacterium]
MDTIAVSIKNVSKKFRLFNSPSERLLEAFHPFKKKYHQEFWALKDISFDVKKGKTLGIIGLNGSGKSTLLQIICSVLKPTSGSVSINGRISALLELGADFNPEFSGRENVFMKCISMGFSKKEILKQLPLIEEFAEIGDFIDQPVKTYSSGMFVRLAFATAINVDPDILIVDEALAVGDAKFQYKCYLKFRELQKKKVTILFVSHSLEVIANHCQDAILLVNGSIHCFGKPKDTINRYTELLAGNVISSGKKRACGKIIKKNKALTNNLTKLQKFLYEIPDNDWCVLHSNYNKNEHRYGDKKAEIVDYLIISNNTSDPSKISSGDNVDIYLKVKCYETIQYPNYGIRIKTVDGIFIFGTNALLLNITPPLVKKNKIEIYKFSLKMSLAPGEYFIGLGVGSKPSIHKEGIPIDRRYDMIHLSIESRANKYFSGIVNLACSLEQCNSEENIGL